jgi:hypothetical protein
MRLLNQLISAQISKKNYAGLNTLPVGILLVENTVTISQPHSVGMHLSVENTVTIS